MNPHQPIPEPLILIGAAIAVFVTWYAYQIASRKKQWLRFKLKRVLVGELALFGSVYVLVRNHLPFIEALTFSFLAGMGAAYLLVREPRGGRRIPKSVRQQVIARDLTAKGLKWDPEKYHIDHIVPYARGGDHSLKNLRVVEKEKNLRKGDKMPRARDFFQR